MAMDEDGRRCYRVENVGHPLLFCSFNSVARVTSNVERMHLYIELAYRGNLSLLSPATKESLLSKDTFPGVKCKQTKGYCKQNALCNTYRYHRRLFSILYTIYAVIIHHNIYHICNSFTAISSRLFILSHPLVLFIYSVLLVVAVSSEINTYYTSYFTGHWTHRENVCFATQKI